MGPTKVSGLGWVKFEEFESSVLHCHVFQEVLA